MYDGQDDQAVELTSGIHVAQAQVLGTGQCESQVDGQWKRDVPRLSINLLDSIPLLGVAFSQELTYRWG